MVDSVCLCELFYCLKIKKQKVVVVTEISAMTEKAFSVQLRNQYWDAKQHVFPNPLPFIPSPSFISISSIFSIHIHYTLTQNLYNLNRLDLDTDKMGGEGQSQSGKEYSKRKSRRADCYRPWSRSGSRLVTNPHHIYVSTCTSNRLAFPLRGPYGRCALVHHGVLCECFTLDLWHHCNYANVNLVSFMCRSSCSLILSAVSQWIRAHVISGSALPRC